jgi:hypothetical protein
LAEGQFGTIMVGPPLKSTLTKAGVTAGMYTSALLMNGPLMIEPPLDCLSLGALS